MNFRFVFSQLGLLMIVLSVVMGALAGWEALEYRLGFVQELAALEGTLFATGVGLFVGGLMWLYGRSSRGDTIGRREAVLLVALGWVVGAALAALPFWAWALLRQEGEASHVFREFINCYFEAMSGLTTTGATVLGPPDDIEALPRGLLLWRSITHWMGGLGIVVLFVAVLPTLGVGSKRLVRSESTGVTKKGVRPRIKETARVLWMIYLVMTIAAIFCLRGIGQMSWFDSFCHGMSMVSTGGLSTRDASIGAFNSARLDLVCVIFMLAAGVNFAVFYQMIRGNWRATLKDVELRVYLILKVVVIAIVTVNLIGVTIVTTAGEFVEGTFFESLRFATFNTVALHTGTGFCTADYDLWPFISRSLLVGLMFVGGCAGSTAGGLKVVRFWVACKVVAAELERVFRPQVVRAIRIGGHPLDPDARNAVMVYVVAFFMLCLLGAFLFQWCEPVDSRSDFLTALSASLSTLANVGPGLHEVGATKNYAWVSDGGKVVLSLLMALGRLEIFTILVVLTPVFWRNR